MKNRGGFTLLELLVAMVILVIAMSIAFQAFSGTIRGWKRGSEVIDGIKHGDFAMTQLVKALRSTIYFYNSRKTYAFKIEKENSDGFPADSISFVTSSSAFIPKNSPFSSGPHRIRLFVGPADSGGSALFATPMPAVVDDEAYEDEYNSEPLLVSRAIQGMEILLWDKETEDWVEDWEKENSIPERIRIVLFVASENEDEEPIEFTRILEIPVALSVKEKLASPSSTAGSSGTATSTGGGNINISR